MSEKAAGGLGCVGALVMWAVLIGAVLWAFYDYAPKEAAQYGIMWGAGIVIGLPLAIVGAVLAGAAVWTALSWLSDVLTGRAQSKYERLSR